MSNCRWIETTKCQGDGLTVLLVTISLLILRFLSPRLGLRFRSLSLWLCFWLCRTSSLSSGIFGTRTSLTDELKFTSYSSSLNITVSISPSTLSITSEAESLGFFGSLRYSSLREEVEKTFHLLHTTIKVFIS